MLEIEIILVGNVKNSIDRNFLKSWNSKIFKIAAISELTLSADRHFSDPICSYEKILESIKANKLTFAVSNYYFPGNMISMPLDPHLINLSVYDFEKSLMDEKLRLEKFLLRFVYGIAAIYLTNNNELPKGTNLVHSNVEGCLFDYCRRHHDALKFHNKPTLCSDSIATLEKMQRPENFINNLQLEISQLGRSRLEKMELWVKQNQALTALVTIALGFVLGVITSLINPVL